MHLQRIVSGGQTGVDRAALDIALAHGLEVGGWCPRGRRAEDGRVPMQYPLRPTPSTRYAQRTRWNVRDSDATLILAGGAVRGGTALAAESAKRLGRPVRVARPSREQVQPVAGWIRSEGVRSLHVAGPRESEEPGIYLRASSFLDSLLAHLTR